MKRPCRTSVTASAPGRVNLIGEHTDYNDGFVLPAAISLQTRVALTPRADHRANVSSDAYIEAGPQTYVVGAERAGRGWLDYVQGVTWALAQGGQHVGGFDARITSELPPGGGLSSSAALEVALLRALRAAFSLPLDDVAIARLGQAAENGFVGAQTGIMDQMASSLATPGAALFLDTRSLERRGVPLPPGAALAVIDSGIRHGHAHGGYNSRRAECAAACRLLGVASLRELTEADSARIAALPEPLNRRVRHVVTENARVLAAVAALEAGELARLGALFSASHASQRDDYDVSLPEIDRLVALAEAEPGVFGARLTGGGWGGCILVLTEAATARRAAERAATAYARESGRPARVLLAG